MHGSKKPSFPPDIRVCRTGNLSNLHTILASRSFDAVFVSTKNTRIPLHERSAPSLADAFAPCHHRLGRPRLTALLSGRLHRIPASVTWSRGTARAGQKACRDRKNSFRYKSPERNGEAGIRAGVGNRDAATNPATGRASSRPAFEVAGSLHAKLALILETIAKTGTAGIDIATLARRIWGVEEPKTEKRTSRFMSPNSVKP